MISMIFPNVLLQNFFSWKPLSSSACPSVVRSVAARDTAAETIPILPTPPSLGSTGTRKHGTLKRISRRLRARKLTSG